MKNYTITRLIKTEDLNHHETLFAGKMAEWFIEGAFIAAADTYGNPDNIVCLNLQSLKFSSPLKRGDIITLTTKIILAGTTSLTVYGKVIKNKDEKVVVEGFVTFICVDLDGKKMSHNIVLSEPEDEEEAKLRELAKSLR